MARIVLGDKTGMILKGILSSRGMNGASVAKAIRKPVSTVRWWIRNTEDISISNFRRFVDVTAMTDEEIVKVIRG